MMFFNLKYIFLISYYLSTNAFSKFFSSKINVNKYSIAKMLNEEYDDGFVDISLGAPKSRPENSISTSPYGVKITREVSQLKDASKEIKSMVENLNDNKGILLTSSYEFPGRYARWTVGFIAPPIQIEGKSLSFKISSLNSRGNVLSDVIFEHLSKSTDLFEITSFKDHVISGNIIPKKGYFSEEERSKQSTLFSLVRSIRDLFATNDSDQLGLFGSFGYDLTFQFGRF